MLRDHHRPILARCLLYGSPILAAILMLSVRQVIHSTGLISSSGLDVTLFIANALLAALGSAAGAVWLPNRLAIRIPHALAASLVSIAVYVLVCAVFIAVQRYFLFFAGL